MNGKLYPMAKVQLGKMGALHPANRLAAYLTGRVASSRKVAKPPQVQSSSPAPQTVVQASVGGTAQPVPEPPGSPTGRSARQAQVLPDWFLRHTCLCSPSSGSAHQRHQALHGSGSVFVWEGSPAAVPAPGLQQSQDGPVPGQVQHGRAVLPQSRRPALPPAPHEPAEDAGTQPAR